MSRIYICDDDKMVLNMLSRVLGEQNSVETAQSVEELMNLVDRESPDLLLLDYLMPGCNGLQGLELLKSKGYPDRFSVIMITGEQQPELEITSLNLGVEDFINKPFKPDVLTKRVQMILDRKASQEDMNRKMEEITFKSFHDSMTGLYNREYAEKNIDRLLEETGKGAFAMIDLDNFKYLNDAYGHRSGDDAICVVAGILEESSRDKGFSFRLGGDEFGIFLNRYESRADVEKFITDLFGEYNRQAVEKDFLVNSSLSIGIAIAFDDGRNFEELYAAADKALYCAKRDGKNGYCFYTADFTDTARSRAEVVDIRQLRKLIEDRKEIRDRRGIYKVDYREFQRIYNFIERCLERTHQTAKLVMVALNCEHDENPRDIEIKMKSVEQAIAGSLRRNDVGTRYSITQYLLVLIDVQEGAMENVIENRIKKKYTEISGRDSGELIFEEMDIEEEE